MTEKHDIKKDKVILIVDDEEINLKTNAAILKKLYEVDIALNGREAIDKAGEKIYSAILMDINMWGGIDGLMATREIRKIPGYLDIPIIAFTANTTPEDYQNCFDAGCSHFIPKPFNIEDFKTFFLKILG